MPSALKTLKYRVLRHLPGKKGIYYERRYKRAVTDTQADFKKAVAACAGTTCVDLGANQGEFTRILARACREVIAVEPDPWTAELLRRNISDLANVKVVEAAAGTRDGQITMYRHQNYDDDPAWASQATSVFADKADTQGGMEITVAEIDFCRMLEDIQGPIGLIKMDVEGAEVDLLESLLDRPDLCARISHVFVEMHDGMVPSLRARSDQLFLRCEAIEKPLIDLGWH